MIIDEDDLLIIKEFCKLNGGETSTWQIMRKFHPEGRDTEHMRIKKRIERMAREGLFHVEGKPKQYMLIRDYVKINKLPKMKDFICVQCEGKWEIFEM